MTKYINKDSAPWWFWLVTAGLLIWSLVGISIFTFEMALSDDGYAAAYGEYMLDIRKRVPIWSVAGYGIGVWAGLAGATCLLLRVRWAFRLYILSFIGASIGFSWYLLNPIGRTKLAGGGWIMIVVVMILCAVSIGFSKHNISAGTLR